MTAPQSASTPKFTVLIRLPFPRGDFVDPPPVDWNAAKDQALWDVLSRPSKGDDIDWKALADRFDVTLQFLLQQAAWLYDRQLSQVRAQMRKVGTTQSHSPSPVPGSISGSTALPRPASGSAPRVPSRLASQQKDPPPPRAPAPRRTSSGNTIPQVPASRDPLRTETPPTNPEEPRWDTQGRPSTGRREPPAPAPHSPAADGLSSTSSVSESESDDSDSDSEMLASRRGMGIKRFGKASTHRPGLRDDDADDDDDEPPLLLALSCDADGPDPADRELGETLRLNARPQTHTPRRSLATESSASSASSSVPAVLPNRRRLHQSSPRRPRPTAELARLSPRRSVASGRETSDGTPSMGSSFSDLDDASVTQSALEEALLSNMQHGGMASRMSTISQALRSRYL
ncbi:multidomain presynaptic cytomatrix related protein [Aspergillus candidus]|uniref:Autophagy-related protein 29 n=1 Tax=Aspergillus candidus TaxID=41067 RepID=A0A2I2FLW9_ASPCN|nr:hypothetical protein BDW47DRAFT_56671 [Aspergillus candidus]PLB41626.1 hypothetical protein BDW47DRAFT_56671 [Aspergillus candidus]